MLLSLEHSYHQAVCEPLATVTKTERADPGNPCISRVIGLRLYPRSNVALKFTHFTSEPNYMRSLSAKAIPITTGIIVPTSRRTIKVIKLVRQPLGISLLIGRLI